jgi:hypothetical protein
MKTQSLPFPGIADSAQAAAAAHQVLSRESKLVLESADRHTIFFFVIEKPAEDLSRHSESVTAAQRQTGAAGFQNRGHISVLLCAQTWH